MHVQEIYYRRPNRVEVSFHLTSRAKWRLTERCVAIVRLLAEIRHQQWLRAESVGAYRTRTLLEDNPTSG